MLGVFSTFAKNIQPVENVGRIKVELPDLRSLPQAVQDEFKSKFHTMKFRNTDIQSGVEYFVDAGPGCASMDFYGNFISAANICDAIKPGQITTIKFTAVHFEWDLTNLQTDIGPSANFSVFSEKGDIVTSTSALDSNYISKNLYLGAPGVYKGVFHVANTMDVIDENSVTVSTPQTINVSPKDVRQEIVVEFLNGPVKFNLPNISRAYLVYRSNPQNDATKTLLPKYKTYYGGYHGYIVNYKELDPQKTSQSFTYFPFDKNAYSTTSSSVLEVISAETSWPLSFEKGLKQVVPIEIINVNNFQTGKPGVFQFARKDATKWTPILTDIGIYGDFAQGGYLQTPSTLLLLPGYQYQFDFYLKDDFGKLLKQDTVTLDLK